MNLMELSARLSLDSSDYERGLSAAERGIGTLETALKAFVFGKVVKKFIGLAQDAVNTGMAFDSAMSQVAATMGVSVDQIANLRDFAKEMGATTRFSAVEAAQALNYMALAGYDAEKSMKTLPTVLNLAAAGGMDLARASDMVTDAESALGLTAEQTSAMVDQMARTASRSNTNVEQLGDAMLTIGGTAKFMAGGTDRLQTVLGLLADNGIKGSEAGTHLRNVLLKLSSPTEDGAAALENLGVKIFDAGGNMRDMQNIMLDLNGALSSLTQEQRMQTLAELFNTRDLAAVNALLGTTEERWNELGATIAEASGSAHEMAGTQLGNLTGDITIMKSAMEGAKITLAEGITPALRDVVQRITKALARPKTQKFLKEAGEFLGKIIKRIAEFTANVAFPRLVKLFEDGGKKVKTFGGIVLGLVGTLKTITTVTGVLAGTLSPTGLLLKGIGLLVGAFVAADLAQEDYINNMRYLTDEQRELVGSIEDANAAHQETVDAYRNSASDIMAETGRVQDLWKELQALTDEEGNVREGYEGRANFILNELNKALGTEYELNGNIITQYQDMQSEIDNLIVKRSAEALLSAKEAGYTEAIQKREQALRDAGKAYDEMMAVQADYNSQLSKIAQMEADADAARAAGRDGEAAALRLQIETAKAATEDAQLSLAKFQSAYDMANENARTYYADVERYEKAQSAILEGNFQQAQDLLTKDLDYSLEVQRKKAEYNDAEAEKYRSMLAEKKAQIEEYHRNYLAREEGFHREELNSMIRVYNEEVKAAQDAGLNIGNALGIGMAEAKANVIAKASDVVKSAIRAMKNVAQIASPSKVGRGIGRNVGGSVGMGLEDSTDYVMKAADALADGMLDTLNVTPTTGLTGFVGNAGGSGLETVVAVLKDIRDNMGQDIVFPDGTLVARVDKMLGRTSMRKIRGNA